EQQAQVVLRVGQQRVDLHGTRRTRDLIALHQDMDGCLRRLGHGALRVVHFELGHDLVVEVIFDTTHD
ncbi:MAG: hypothetical protein ACK559_20855, partial [bacterium]